MSTAADPSGGWQWVLTTVLGLFSAIFGGAIWHLSGRIEEVSERQRASAASAADRADAGDGKIWDAIDRIRQGLEDDRRIAAAERVEMAAKVVTREDVQRLEDRLLVAIRDRNAGQPVRSAGS